VPAKRRYFGRSVGSPPGLPGGGITGRLPASGFGARISGSTPEGGHNTPSDFASLSPKGALWPVVVPSGTTPPCGIVRVGAQLLVGGGAGGAVWAGGVARAGGACAFAALDVVAKTQARMRDRFTCMPGKRSASALVPGKISFSGLAVAD
jgi:hypothetical protein